MPDDVATTTSKKFIALRIWLHHQKDRLRKSETSVILANNYLLQGCERKRAIWKSSDVPWSLRSQTVELKLGIKIPGHNLAKRLGNVTAYLDQTDLLQTVF